MSDLGDLVRAKSNLYGLDPKIVMCIIKQESNYNQYAWRFEEKFYEKYLKNNNALAGHVPHPLPSTFDEKIQRAASYGLMQILGETARSIAKVKYNFLVELCDIEKNLDCGCRVLRYYLDRGNGDYFKALTGYNGSSVYAHEIQKRMDNKEYELHLGATIS